MKILIVFTVLLACVCAEFSNEDIFSFSSYRERVMESECEFEDFFGFISNWEVGHLSVPLDHFSNDAESRHLTMPYIEISEHFRSGGPIYILICEKFRDDERNLKNGLIVELASETHGALFAIGQRCTSKESTRMSFEYLSTNQILHDIAKFITIMKKKEKYKHSKVVIAGIRSAGNLAFWMKQKFNNLVDVVITETKPKLQLEDSSKLQNIADFFRKKGGEKCIKRIRNKLVRQKKLLRQVNGAEELRKQEILCPGTNLTDKAQWYTYNAVVYSELLNSTSIDDYLLVNLCDNLKKIPQVDKIDYCFDLPNATFWKSRANYLQCKEYGMFETSNDTSIIPLEIPLQWYIDTCRQNYGEEFNEKYIKTAVKNTIEEYSPGNLSNVIILSEKSGVTLSSFNKSPHIGNYLSDWEEYDGVDRVKASVKEYINYLEHRSIDKYFFFLPTSPNPSSDPDRI